MGIHKGGQYVGELRLIRVTEGLDKKQRDGVKRVTYTDSRNAGTVCRL